MRNHNVRMALVMTAGIGCLAGALILSGCAKEEPPVVVAPVRKPAPPPPPPKPTVTPISELMATLRIDERVQLPEALAPDNDPDRIALLELFDAFARGDHQTLAGRLSLADRLELDALVENGSWDRTVQGIELIELQSGESDYGPCVLAVFTVDGGFQPQLWYFQGEETSGYTFEAAPSPPGIIDRLHGSDWIKIWHQILEEEMALADAPDVEYTVPQKNLETDEPSGTGVGPGTGPNRPSGPSGAPPPNRRRKPPPKNPRKAPGPP